MGSTCSQMLTFPRYRKEQFRHTFVPKAPQIWTLHISQQLIYLIFIHLLYSVMHFSLFSLMWPLLPSAFYILCCCDTINFLLGGSKILLLLTQSEEWYLSSCLELGREASNKKERKSWRIPFILMRHILPTSTNETIREEVRDYSHDFYNAFAQSAQSAETTVKLLHPIDSKKRSVSDG